VDQIRIAEIANLSEYSGIDSLKLYGFNEPLDFKPPMFASGVGEGWHASTLWGMADYLGVKLDGLTSTWETAALDYDYEVRFGTINAGRTSAIRWTINGMSNGKPFIVYKKIERMHDSAGPQWEQGEVGEEDASWRVEIVGSPGFVSEINVDTAGGCALTALHPVNAIPAVCAAPPGIIDPLQLPVFYSRTIGGTVG
jgi:4-hydroxy-tetrahydrodipicolinate reductase